MTSNTPDRLLSARAVRELCGNVSDMSLWRWVRAGILPPPTKIRGRKFWPESVVQRLVTEGDRPRPQPGDAA